MFPPTMILKSGVSALYLVLWEAYDPGCKTISLLHLLSYSESVLPGDVFPTLADMSPHFPFPGMLLPVPWDMIHFPEMSTHPG